MAKISIKALFNRAKRLNKDGEALIHLRVIINRVPHYLSTNYWIKPEEWDKKKEEINSKHPNYLEWNQAISNKVFKIKDLIAEYDKRGRELTFPIIRSTIYPEKQIRKNSFLDFMENDIKSRRGIDDKSKAKYNLVLRRLKEISGENLRFDQLNFAFLDKFDNHLITLGLSANSRKKHHDTLKSHINRAIKYGLFSKVNPYSQGYIVPSEEVKRHPISQDDLEKLEKLSFTKDLRRTEKVRDLFLFACRTGMRLDDLLNLDKENIRINGEEMYLTFKPRKSRSQWVIDMPLHLLYDGQPKQIVLKYLHTEHSVIFDHLQEGYVNLTLKKIAKMAGINRALHSHLGKITFITDMAQHHNVQVGLLSSLTGTTEKTLYKHYMKNDPKRRNKALKDIQWKK